MCVRDRYSSIDCFSNSKLIIRLGLVSGNLAPYVKSILGVDISRGVVNLFNKCFADKNADQERFRGIRAEFKGEDGELDNAKFDVIIVRKKTAWSDNDLKGLLTHFLKPSSALIVIDNMETPVPKEYRF